MSNSGLKAVVFSLLSSGLAGAQERAIDTEKSVMVVRVEKSGLFSAFGHDHEIAASIAKGTANTAAHQVELQIEAKSLRVRDPETSDKDRSEIQRTMLGSEVLDVERYPEIRFRSTEFTPAGTGAWKVHGNLTLHGQTHPVVVEGKEEGGHYVGAARFKQTVFGMKPVKVAGGAVRVKDEIRIEFDIQLLR